MTTYRGEILNIKRTNYKLDSVRAYMPIQLNKTSIKHSCIICKEKR
jgi:hypothetical protein